MDSSETDGVRMSQYGCAVAINTLSIAICSAHSSSVKLFLVLEQIRPYRDRSLWKSCGPQSFLRLLRLLLFV